MALLKNSIQFRFVLVFFIILVTTSLTTAQPQSTLIIDTFDNRPNNQLGGEVRSFSDGGATIFFETVTGLDAFGHTGTSLEIRFDVTNTNSFTGLSSQLLGLDLSEYNYLSFWVRAETGGGYFQVQFTTPNDTSKVAIWNYLNGGPSTDWQKVVIPLDAFYRLKSRIDATEFVIVFENFQSTVNGSPLEGAIQIDNIILGTYFPGFLKIEHFDDKLKVNALGGNIGDFSHPPSKTLYTSEIDCENFNLEPCALKINYNNADTSEFGGAFFIFGGDSAGFAPVFQNLSAYTSLHLAVSAVDNSTNPGNFKIELKSETGNHAHQITNITTEFKDYDVSYQQFEPPIDTPDIGQFNIVFERNVQDRQVGMVLIDEIEFRADGYTGEDTLSPPPPTNVTFNGSPIEGSIIIVDEANFSVEMTGDLMRLESVRLEYKEPGDDLWITHERIYTQQNEIFSFAVDKTILPAGRLLQMRIVAENYNARERSSEIFDVIIDNTLFTGENLSKSSFDVFQFLRNEIGVYADAARFEGEQFHPASVATIGMGLISLCIAAALDWINNAEGLALQTLKSMAGLQRGFKPERNKTGYFRHFIDLETGANAWDSEYSSIDTGILVSGALFCKNYFANNDSIAALANALYLSIDWDRAIGEPSSGGIYREFDYTGNGIETAITKPFNEYMIVAWLAMHDFRKNSKATELWENHYTSPENLPTTTFEGIDLLTDFPGNILSGFVIQFTYYLCNYFTTNPDYHQFFNNAMQADKLWWQNNTEEPAYIWGFGAGASLVESGYHADNILVHPGTICSPHIIAGFIPVNSDGAIDLLRIYNDNRGVFQLPDANATQLLWRFSIDQPNWRAEDVQGIDFSTMLFGLATHPTMLGKSFFEEHNNFVFPTETTNQAPVISELPNITFTNDTLSTLELDNFVMDLDDPKSALRWSVSRNDSVMVAIDSVTHIATFSAPEFVGSENILFTVADPSGGSDTAPVLVTVDFPTGIATDQKTIPTEFRLYQNFPNPFNPETTIEYQLPKASKVNISIFNLLGRKVITLVDSEKLAGFYSINWDGKDESGRSVASGLYLYRIETSAFAKIRKLILLR